MSRSVNLAAKANAIATNPFSAQADLDKARTLLKQAKEAQPRGTTWLQIGRAYMELGEFELSRQALEQAHAELPENPAYELFSATLALDSDDYPTAHRHLEELQRICPANQALATARAIYHLRQKQLDEACAILRPAKGKFDFGMAPAMISRVAAAIEAIVLPLELPSAELIAAETKATNPTGKQAAPDQNDESSSTPAPTSEGTTAVSTSEDTTAAPSDEAAAATQPTDADTAFTKPAIAAETDSQPQAAPVLKPLPIGNPAQFAKELEPLLPPLPEGVKLRSISLRSSGSDRLQRSWDLPEAERLTQFTIAVHELTRTYAKSPKAYQAAFGLAEGLLVIAEFDRDRSQRYGERQLELVRRAERLLHEALICDNADAFANHYLGRTAMLQRRFSEAEAQWLSAISEFAKLPEAHYGLGQAMIMNGKYRQGRLFLSNALSSDLHLLHERLLDMYKLTGKA